MSDDARLADQDRAHHPVLVLGTARSPPTTRCASSRRATAARPRLEAKLATTPACRRSTRTGTTSGPRSWRSTSTRATSIFRSRARLWWRPKPPDARARRRPGRTWSQHKTASRSTWHRTDTRPPTPSLPTLPPSCERTHPPRRSSAMMAWVHDRLEYVPGVTGVQTSAVEAARAGRGVCQDFAHLSLALLRAAGVPARYVSGYLHPKRRCRDRRATCRARATLGSRRGRVNWWAFDPTNAIDVGVRHVMVARGRDYSDVPPVKGVYAGNADNCMSVEVVIARMG